MPLTRDMLDGDLRGVLADFPQTATFSRGAKRFSVPCAIEETGASGTVGDGAAGMALDETVSATVPAAECVFVPKAGDLCAVSGANRGYRVSAVRFVPGDAACRIELGVA